MNWRFTLINATEGSLILSDEPIGWAEVLLNIKRDMKWHGIFFEYAVNLKFYEEGYDYIKTVYDEQGIDAYVELLIEQQCDDDSGYSDFYNGKLLMGKCLFDCKDDCIVEVPIEPAGCMMKLKNRMDQAVDLSANKDFNGNALTAYSKMPFDLTILPKAIVLRSLAYDQSIDQSQVIANYVGATQTISSGSGEQRIDDVAYLAVPVKNIFLNELSAAEQNNAMFDNLTSIPPFLTAPFTGTYDFEHLLTEIYLSIRTVTAAGIAFCGGGSLAPFHDFSATLHLYVNGSSAASVVLDSYTGNCTSPGPRVLNVTNASLSASLSLSQGDACKLVIRFTTGGDWHRHLVNNEDIYFEYAQSGPPAKKIGCETSVTATILADPTDTKAFAINEALSRTVEAITNDCMRVKSNYFGRTDSQPYTSASDGCGSLEILTKGLLLRGFESTMPVSFQDLFNSLNAIHNIGIGIENDTNRTGFDWVRVEPMEYFYDSAIIMECDNVPHIKKKVMAEWYPSTIEIGYEKWETENSMGLDEFCTRRSYRTTLSEVKNSIVEQCKFIASGYSIEVTRNKEFIADSTKDWRLDNDIFIICVKRSGPDLVVEQGIDCADTAGMTDILEPDSIYNYRISPIRNFMRWVKAYMAIYFSDINAANAKFIFTNGDGNFLAKGEIINGCIIEGAAIGENEDVDITKFADAADATPLFKNELDEFDYPLSKADLDIIRANPKGTIKYRKLSIDAWSEGFIYSIAYKPNTGIATFTLLPKF